MKLTDKLQEIMNSSISVFHPLADICLYSDIQSNLKIFVFLVLRFDLFDK